MGQRACSVAPAAGRGLAITKLAVWEPPYILDGTRPPPPADYRPRLVDLLAAGRRGDMVELFLTQAVGLPAEFVAPMRQSPFWPSMEAVAHALVYDAMIVGDFSLPTARVASVKVPTLVIDGGQTPWLGATAEAVAGALPDAQRRTLEGRPHNVEAAADPPAAHLNRKPATPFPVDEGPPERRIQDYGSGGSSAPESQPGSQSPRDRDNRGQPPDRPPPGSTADRAKRNSLRHHRRPHQADGRPRRPRR